MVEQKKEKHREAARRERGGNWRARREGSEGEVVNKKERCGEKIGAGTVFFFSLPADHLRKERAEDE